MMKTKRIIPVGALAMALMLLLFGAFYAAKVASLSIVTAKQLERVGILDDFSDMPVTEDCVGEYHDMVRDITNQLHMSFVNCDYDTLVYAKFADGVWYTEPITSGGEILRNRIDVSAGGTPHVSFNKNGVLYHAQLDDVTGWHIDTVAAGTRIHKLNAIAIDSNGNPHIAYSTDWTVSSIYWMSNIEYTYWNGQSWEPPTVLELGNAGSPKSEEAIAPLSIDLSSEDKPLVLYKKRYYGGRFGVRLQELVDGVWQLTELQYAWYNSFPPGAALTIDESDNVYCTYMWHGQRAACNLPADTIVYGEGVGFSDVDVVDEHVYIALQRYDELQLAEYGAENGWQLSTPPAQSVFADSDISIASVSGFVHVTYLDETQTLRHLITRNVPPEPDLSPSIKQVSSSQVLVGQTLTYTIRIQNNSDLVTANATLTDTLPEGTTFIPDSGVASGGFITITNGTLLWSGDVTYGNPVEVRYAVSVDACSDGITNTMVLDDGFGNLYERSVHSDCTRYQCTIDNGADYTNVPVVSIAYSWNPDDAITHVQICNDGDYGSDCPINLVDPPSPNEISWEITTYGDYVLPRLVYIKYLSHGNEIRSGVCDDIIYDPVPPDVTNVQVKSNPALVEITAEDPSGSGLDKVWISYDADFASCDGEDTDECETHQFGGELTVSIPWQMQSTTYLRVFDRADNSTDVKLPLLFLPIVINN